MAAFDQPAGHELALYRQRVPSTVETTVPPSVVQSASVFIAKVMDSKTIRK